MKRKISKKVLCLCMVAMLAVGLAIPTFATDYYSIHYRPMRSGSYSYNWLNVNRSSSSIPAKGKNLILWNTASPGTDQTFNEVYRTVGGRGGIVICFSADPSLAVNRSTSTGNAILYTWNNDSSFTDSALTTVSRYDSPKYYSTSPFLCYESDSSNAKVLFRGSGNNVWDN